MKSTPSLDLSALASDFPDIAPISSQLCNPDSWQRKQLTAIGRFWTTLPLSTKLTLLATAIIESPYPSYQVHGLARDRQLPQSELPHFILCETLYCTNCARLIPLPEPIESTTIGCVQCCAACSSSFPQLTIREVIETPISQVPHTRPNWLPYHLSKLASAQQQAIYNSLQYQRLFVPNWKLAQLSAPRISHYC